ncbi:hypothetical protein N0V83_000331 [Neocucurbitaria cava]|uniref:Uncharacterized protein n=1 Tax=Neocucurbitaria cava TaxID=798079 RepID=A0A9W8YGW4_9PLEO|nr:hypothetical protein N0V83_000331 [Neocucurbitaria cava]
MSNPTSRTLYTRDAKRKAMVLLSSYQPKRRTALNPTLPQSHPVQTRSLLLDLPAELRLQIYGQAASGDDPAIELQPLLRTCRLINIEVSGDLAKFTTRYLTEVENEVNKNLSLPVRLSKPSNLAQVSSVALSLPLSRFTDVDGYHQGRTLFTEYKTAEHLWLKLRRKSHGINFYESGVGTSDDIQHYSMDIGKSRIMDIYLAPPKPLKAFKSVQSTQPRPKKMPESLDTPRLPRAAKRKVLQALSSNHTKKTKYSPAAETFMKIAELRVELYKVIAHDQPGFLVDYSGFLRSSKTIWNESRYEIIKERTLWFKELQRDWSEQFGDKVEISIPRELSDLTDKTVTVLLPSSVLTRLTPGRYSFLRRQMEWPKVQLGRNPIPELRLMIEDEEDYQFLTLGKERLYAAAEMVLKVFPARSCKYCVQGRRLCSEAPVFYPANSAGLQQRWYH